LDNSENSNDSNNEGGGLFEEDAALILSTAFSRVSAPVAVKLENHAVSPLSSSVEYLPSSISGGYMSPPSQCTEQLCNTESSFAESDPAGTVKKCRGGYFCGKCGKVKKDHSCSPSPEFQRTDGAVQPSNASA